MRSPPGFVHISRREGSPEHPIQSAVAWAETGHLFLQVINRWDSPEG